MSMSIEIAWLLGQLSAVAVALWLVMHTLSRRRARTPATGISHLTDGIFMLLFDLAWAGLCWLICFGAAWAGAGTGFFAVAAGIGGGEMVLHGTIEDKLQRLAGLSELTFAVAGVPDSLKGERLVVLHTLNETALQERLKRLPQLDLPKLWMPKASQSFHVDKLPVLGSGKLDLRQIREVASRRSEKHEMERTEAASVCNPPGGR